MKYFYDSEEGKVIKVDESGEASLLQELSLSERERERERVGKKGKRAKFFKERSDDEDEGKHMTPSQSKRLEKRNRVIELLNVGTSVKDISRQVGISSITIYKIKKELHL